MAKVSHLIFDLDGTLVDTLKQLAYSFCAVARDLNIKEPSLEEAASYIGNGVTKALARTINGKFETELSDVDSTLLKRARQLFNYHYTIGLYENAYVYDNVISTLKELKSMGIKLSVLTNKDHVFAVPLLKSLELYSLFDFVLGSEVIEKRKPDPDGIFYIIDKLKTNKDETIMVGDSINDVEAAMNANIRSIVFPFGYNNSRDVNTFNASYVCKDYKELLDLIKTLNK